MPSQTPDTTVQVTPGTTASFAIERAKGVLFQPIMQASAYGDLIGKRDAYVVNAKRVLGAANRWLLTLMNDAASTFVEVSKVWVSQASSAAITGLPVEFNMHRITFRTGGALSTAVALDTASPSLAAPQIRIRARQFSTSATSAGEISTVVINPEETAGPSMTREMFDERDCGEPLLLRQGQGVGVQCGRVTPIVTVPIWVHIAFRTRYA